MPLLLDWLFPRRCYFCRRPGGYFCPDCLPHLKFRSVRPPFNRFDGRLSFFRYHRGIKDAIHDLKFSFATSIVPELIPVLVSGLHTHYPQLLHYWQQEKFTIVPIPLHPHRQNWRGFNQSAILAESLSQNLNLGFSSDLLFRSRFAPPQTQLPQKSLRRANLVNSFVLNSSSNHPPANIILFDDVFTTGSTLTSAASVFPSQSRLWALTLAG